ncbi:hypothetical protein CY0110_16057 [Crocosphaera chwakensis CCY0110]|uniref:Uncharacterized protein n=1 Tax=Crocosphaera chwakensis CCY0110 TaxID=391612 RepID=A3IHP3_9CHRO|nr:hypothetical protein CY0110_16057 [Crocosphaera chwakensis CCY0110]
MLPFPNMESTFHNYASLFLKSY